MATVDRGTTSTTGTSEPEAARPGEPARVWLAPDPVATEERVGAAPASWGRRVAATLLDGVLIAVLGFFVAILLGIAGTTPSVTAYRAGWAALALVYAILMLTYNGGQTAGKEAMRIRVVEEDGAPIGLGRAAGREVLKVVLQVLLFLPYLLSVLWPLWQPEKRALHDLAAGTRVVKAPRKPPNGYYDAADVA
jgi:uncharacterized RDD family membrane protein YckC